MARFGLTSLAEGLRSDFGRFARIADIGGVGHFLAEVLKRHPQSIPAMMLEPARRRSTCTGL